MRCGTRPKRQAAQLTNLPDDNRVLDLQNQLGRHNRTKGHSTMRKTIAVLVLTMAGALPTSAAKKDTGTTTLKDVRPAGTTDTKDKKKQQYDFIFEASGHHYTCRTHPKTSVKASEFVVGSDVKYEVDGDKSKLKTTAGKKVECTVVRVEKIAGPSQ